MVIHECPSQICIRGPMLICIASISALLILTENYNVFSGTTTKKVKSRSKKKVNIHIAVADINIYTNVTSSFYFHGTFEIILILQMLKILIENEDGTSGNKTTNIVYKEILNMN